jgi:hypothetical protein
VPAVTHETREGDAAVALAATIQGWEPDLQAGADMSGHGKETAASQGHHHKRSTHDEGRRIGREDTSSLTREMHEERRVGRRGGEAKATVIARQARKEQLHSGKAVRARVTWRGFDAQRKTGGGDRPVLMASQQMERGGGVPGLGGPNGTEPARSRVRAEAFYRWPAQLVSSKILGFAEKSV